MAARSAPLRAVAAGEKVAPARPKSVAEAAKGGNQRELLVAMRDRIAEAVTKPDCPPRELAALTRRLQDIAKDLAMIDAQDADRSSDEAGAVDDTYDPEAI